MLLLIFFLISLFAALGTGALAALSDLRGLTIPNLHSALVIAAFVVAYGVLWVFGRDDILGSPLSHLLAALIVFFATLAMFSFGIIGGADSKLGTAFALWTGLSGLMAYLFYMAVFGGVLGLTALALRRWKFVKYPPAGSWIARVQAGEDKVPYGVAIVLGALASFINLGYFSREVLSSFLLS